MVMAEMFQTNIYSTQDLQGELVLVIIPAENSYIFLAWRANIDVSVTGGGFDNHWHMGSLIGHILHYINMSEAPAK
jgi:hypothetical protein